MKNKDKIYRVEQGVLPQKTGVSKRKILVVGGVVMLVCTIAFKFISGPVHGRATKPHGVVKLAPRKSAPAQVPASTSDSPYYHLNLPAGYRQQSVGQPVPGTLYQQTVVKASALGSQIISISIAEGAASAQSAYELRTQPGAHFTRSTLQVHGETIELFSDTQVASVVAFWQHGGKLAMVGANSAIQSLGDEGNQAQREALLPLLEGWQWL